MIAPELALTKTFIDLLVSSDAYETSRMSSLLGSVLTDTDAAESAYVPAAFAAALRAVESDLPRLRAAAEAAVQLDLYEVLDVLIGGLRRVHDPRLLGVIATLMSNPALSKDEFDRHTRDLAAFRTALPSIDGLLQVRLKEADPTSTSEKLVAAQVWPGDSTVEALSRFAPVVYVSADGAPSGDYWRIVGALGVAGARVRRVPTYIEHLPHAAWATEHAPLVAWSGSALATWKRVTGFDYVRNVMVGSDLDSKLAIPRFLNNVRKVLPSGWILRPAGDTAAVTESLTFNVETLREGAFDQAEMLYLGAAGRSVLQGLSREVLVPKESDRHRWAFDQLITLRLVQGYKAHRKTKMADARRLYLGLHDIAVASESSEVAYDANGNLYVDQGDGFRTIDGGQEALGDVLRIDEAFKPFKLGGGLVPDLLQPSRRTQVDPRVQGGSPTLRDRRMSARAVYEVFDIRGEEVTRSAYPELNGAEIADAVAVGRAIENQRRR